MDKITNAYLSILNGQVETKRIIKESAGRNVITVTMLDDMNYTPTEEEDQNVINDCIKNHVGYERGDGIWTFHVDVLYVDKLKKVLMDNWRVGEGIEASLEGIESAFDDAVDLDGVHYTFNQFFADEIRKSGYESIM